MQPRLLTRHELARLLAWRLFQAGVDASEPSAVTVVRGDFGRANWSLAGSRHADHDPRKLATYRVVRELQAEVWLMG